jgi:uncharacterized protein (DUF849 family)
MPTWDLLLVALELKRDFRVGFEDTIQLPDGSLALNNAELVAAAIRICRPLPGL